MTDTLADTMKHTSVSLEEHYRISQFYYREARLLDERHYQQWLTLLAEDITYTVQARHTPALDPALRGTEALLDLAHDTSSGLAPPLRDDNRLTLTIRALRAFKMNSWTDNPPARTRRFVSNIEAWHSGEQVETFSNLLLTYSRYGQDNHLYSARRHDVLCRVDQEYRIVRRDVLPDWNVTTGPSAGVMF